MKLTFIFKSNYKVTNPVRVIYEPTPQDPLNHPITALYIESHAARGSLVSHLVKYRALTAPEECIYAVYFTR